MKIDFQKVISDPDEAKSLITTRAKTDDELGAADNLEFYAGKHFGERGRHWTGPQPETPNDSASIAKIEREFVSKNAIKEATNGHRDAVIAREPEWAFMPKRPLAKKGDILNGQELTEDEKPNEKESALINEIHAALTVWWNERDILGTLQEAATNLLTTRRAVLRIYLPPGTFGANVPKAANLEDALSRIHLTVHPYNQAGVFTDEVSMAQIGVLVSEEEGQTTVELTYLHEGMTIHEILVKEKSNTKTPYTPPSNQIKSVFSGESEAEEDVPTAIQHELGGRLLIHEASLPEPFVSRQMRESNKSLNKGKTLRGHILNEAGFPETTLFNAAIPGILEDDPKREGGKRFVPDPIARGVNVINSWQGIEYDSGDGTGKKIATPSAYTRDIPSLQAFIECERADYQDILEEGQQPHKLIAGDATANGVSRVQAKAIFGMSVLPTVSRMNKIVRWVGEGVIALASEFMRQAGRYEELRMNADCRVDTGPVLPEEVDMVLGLVEKKVVTRARLQRLIGVEDTEAEDAAILADEEKLRDPLKKVQTERAMVNLQKDKQGGQDDSAIGDRIEKGVTDVGVAA